MKPGIKVLSLLISIIQINSLIASGQNSLPDQFVYNSTSFDERIKTVQLYREEWNLSYPIVRLNSQEKLVLHFDLMGDHSENYYYTFIHCDKDWKKSDIFERDYLNGEPNNPIEEYKPSFNTTTGYYHYKVGFPNDRVSITRSGNYVVKVYPADNPEQTVLTQRLWLPRMG